MEPNTDRCVTLDATAQAALALRPTMGLANARDAVTAAAEADGHQGGLIRASRALHYIAAAMHYTPTEPDDIKPELA